MADWTRHWMGWDGWDERRCGGGRGRPDIQLATHTDSNTDTHSSLLFTDLHQRWKYSTVQYSTHPAPHQVSPSVRHPPVRRAPPRPQDVRYYTCAGRIPTGPRHAMQQRSSAAVQPPVCSCRRPLGALTWCVGLWAQRDRKRRGAAGSCVGKACFLLGVGIVTYLFRQESVRGR
jgi:hypothetical protein